MKRRFSWTLPAVGLALSLLLSPALGVEALPLAAMAPPPSDSLALLSGALGLLGLGIAGRRAPAVPR